MPEFVFIGCRRVMIKRSLLLTCLVLCLSAAISHGAMIQQGTPIEVVRKAMSEAGYNDIGLDTIPTEKEHQLAFWSVDQGVLIVHYSTISMKVINLSFRLSDERPKATRRTFDFNVIRFNTDSGELLIQTRRRPRTSGRED